MGRYGTELPPLPAGAGLSGVSHHRLRGDLATAVLVQNIALEDDIIMAIWSCVGYTVLLCFTLFKTGSLAKSVFQAH